MFPWDQRSWSVYDVAFHERCFPFILAFTSFEICQYEAVGVFVSRLVCLRLWGFVWWCECLCEAVCLCEGVRVNASVNGSVCVSACVWVFECIWVCVWACVREIEVTASKSWPPPHPIPSPDHLAVKTFSSPPFRLLFSIVLPLSFIARTPWNASMHPHLHTLTFKHTHTHRHTLTHSQRANTRDLSIHTHAYRKIHTQRKTAKCFTRAH